MSAHRTSSNSHRSDSHYRASQDGDSRRTDSTFIKDELTVHPGITASTTPADNAVANYAATAIIRSKYDLDCFYPATLQLLAIIDAVMPMAVKYSGVSYPGESAPSTGKRLRIEWNATTIPTPLAVQNICIKHLKKHNKAVEKGIANILTKFCMSKDFDDQTKGDIAELYLKPVTDINAFYQRDMDLHVTFDDEGKPLVGYRTFKHIGIYHDLEGIRSQYLASAMAGSTGPRQRWFSGVVVQEVIRFIRKLLDKASNRWMQNASILGTSAADFVIEEEAIRALPAFMATIGGSLSTHYANWDKYGSILFVAHCLETITTVAIHYFAQNRLACPTVTQRREEYFSVLASLCAMPPTIFQHHVSIITSATFDDMPTQPPLPSVLFGSAIQFTPISEDVDLKLKELREKYLTRRQVFSALDALDELKNTSNLPVNDVVGAPVMDPLQVNNLGVIPGSSTEIEISMPLLAVGPDSDGLNHSEHWKVLFASAETMGLTNFIASKLQGAPNTLVATGNLVLTPDVQAAIADYYATATPESLGTLIAGLALISPYDAGIYEDVEQSYNLHMDLDGNVTVNQS